MKIIVLGTRGFPNVQGGVETHCENLYPRLAGLGCDVTVLTRRPYVDPGVTSHRGVRRQLRDGSWRLWAAWTTRTIIAGG
jgi:hypothetical protein